MSIDLRSSSPKLDLSERTHQSLTAHFPFALKAPPNRLSAHGIGAIAAAIPASSVVAPPTPSFWYIGKANRGKAAESVYRASIFAPEAEAPKRGP